MLSEAVDQVSIIRFGPDTTVVESQFTIGMSITDPDGPHGVAVAPGGGDMYITTAHGLPGGSLW
ncbi:MAG: hypothetical protein FJ202_05200, partial [Gemmatimonadetes bacterium]|nr:hypothetical protein [Gemmatimonadota bacterium]